MKISDFTYDLPAELIAQLPLSNRSASRLLVVEGATRRLNDSSIRDLPSLLAPGDLLVFNNTRVVAARVTGHKPSGGAVELFLERALEAQDALVQMRASKPIREGLEVRTAGGIARVVSRHGDLWRVTLPAVALDFFDRWGETPLPPYIRRTPDAADRERYQSIFAKEPGAVAAPTASLHFDHSLIEALEAGGVRRAFITLHVGAGTFQPVRAENIDAHVMHAERFTIDAQLCEAVASARADGRRVIAVGTTVARALESAAARAMPLESYSGETQLFIRPGYRFRVVDALLTNFHLPESTLLMLVCAYAGTSHVLAAYAHAVRERYRFFSYGDAMFVTPPRNAA